ncbi:3-hydroxyisobutyryl-CoA hydrolase, mitochondrial-like [Planoprotostelium fungivorum]|uniref:3-hydroxyisobutyryl-CoA hydrolase n=1 Tax=Planoprotostelium fungivorum TaxID=1890364 RepID=A0A2P6NK09_9EUKA|nr:3-hydroxyisobutyryl-CoA hydrolase, mitochondrial-like [Planoprotostelium fungivorum]
MSFQVAKRLNLIQRHVSPDISVRRMTTEPTLAQSPLVLYDNFDNGLKIVRLNRPKALNAINEEMVSSMINEYSSLFHQSQKRRVIFLTGEGGKAFCAGGDIKALQASSAKKDPKLAESFFRSEYKLDYLLWHLNENTISPHPLLKDVTTIANMSGITMGGGVGLSISSQIRIVTQNTVFAMPETGIGLFPDVGGTFFLSKDKLKGPLGVYIGVTGQKLSGADCIYAGIGTHYVDAQKLGDLLEELKRAEFSEKDTARKIVEKYSSTPGPSALAQNEEKIRRHFSEDSVEGIVKSLQSSDDEWAQKTHQTVMSKSPSSMKVTLRGILTGGGTLHDTFKKELRMAIHSVLSDDFAEGVRAVLVDKDNKPKWNPPNLSAVTQERVDSYFKPVDNVEDLQLDRNWIH